jgi:hypothetical protein
MSFGGRTLERAPLLCAKARLELPQRHSGLKLDSIHRHGHLLGYAFILASHPLMG